jgi:predicted DNA-binding transcriptional regulator YafY
MRVFRLSRLEELEVTDVSFDRDPHFDLSRFWKRWCRRFESRPIARYWVTLALTAAGRSHLLERYGGWHAEPLAHWDDSAERNVVTLDLENEDIAARVLFELSGEGQVLQPERLQQVIRERANAVLGVERPV